MRQDTGESKLILCRHEQRLARDKQDAPKGNVAAEDRLAQETPGALRVPGSAKILVEVS
jgi:hypothetical protein